MKKIVCVLLVVVFTFAFTACGNDFPETVADQDAVVQNVETTETESDSAGDPFDPLEGEPIISNGEYICYDRFSGEKVGGAWIEVHDSNSAQVVFSYVSSAGCWGPVTVNIDGSGQGSITLNSDYSDVTLEMTFNGSVITVDELQGMGAMAYEFRR